MYDYHIYTIVALFIVLDVVSGFGQAIINKTISSTKMRQGLGHKFAYVIAIVAAMLCEYGSQFLELGFSVPITAPVCAFVCLTELVSIIENVGKLNPELANSKLLDFFSQNKNRRDGDNVENR